MTFVHLHVHSEYSLLDSVCRLPDLIHHAKSMGYQALAVTDTNVLYGALPFYRLCKEAGIQPIIGMKMKASRNSKTPPLSLVLLAKNETGYKQLVAISTKIQQSDNKTISLHEIAARHQGVIALISCTENNAADQLRQGQQDALIKDILFLKESFQQDVYLEIQDHGNSIEKESIKHLVRLSNQIALPLVATNGVRYLTQDQALAHQVLNGIRDGVKQQERDSQPLNHNYYLKSPDEMAALFPAIPEALANTKVIADQCQIAFSLNTYRLPKFSVPSPYDSQTYLRYLTEEGLKRRYPIISDKIRRRINLELEIIHNMGFDDYFLIVWDIIHYATHHGINPGPGRGSAAGSVVCYCLDIIDVDPIKHNLLFERFLNPERITMPDIDIDFPDVSRDTMIHYVCEKYGKEHAAQIITFGTLAAKAAVRDVGRVLNVSPRLVDKLAKMLPGKPGTRLKQAFENLPVLRKMIDQSPELKKLTDIALEVEGLPRHTSIHAAGIVISEAPLTDMVPLQEGRDGIPLTQYPMEELEAFGLLKMDFLGLRNLTLIEELLEIIHSSNVAFDLAHIPENDPTTFRLLGKGETSGIFQLESHGMREVLKKLQPTVFEDIVAVNALFRPGPMQNISHYIQGKHFPDKIIYPHPDLESILSSTYGVIVYQEQIMQIASKMAGFTLAQADILRRAVSKKKREVLEEQQYEFVQGCLEKGYNEETAIQIYRLIVRFADFGFNRSHAVAYSLISYRLAYLKAHFPIPFMTALLSSVMHHSEKVAELIFTGKNEGVHFSPPSVNQSNLQFSAENDTIRFGLGAIRNVGHQAVNDILSARQKGLFKNLFDFCERISLRKVNRRAIESLIFAGALDEFNPNRAILLASLDRIFKQMDKRGANERFEQTRLLENEPDDFIVDVPPLSLADQLHFEKEALGFYLFKHPVELLKHRLRGYKVQAISELENSRSQTGRIAVFINKCRQVKTKKGQLMAFLTVSDPTGQKEMIVFPAVYENNRAILQEEGLIYGEISYSDNDNDQKWVLKKVTPLADLPVKDKPATQSARQVFIKIDESHDQPEILYKVKQRLEQYHGSSAVLLHYEKSGKTLALSFSHAVEPSAEFLKVMERLIGKGNVMIKEK